MRRQKRWLWIVLLAALCVFLYVREPGAPAQDFTALPAQAQTGAPAQEAAAAPESASQGAPDAASESSPQGAPDAAPDEHGSYDSRDDVAAYLRCYGRLPDNYLSKSEAQALGWSGGSLEDYAPGKCIGGSRFGNYEGLLPQAAGRRYYECDIDTLGASSRGAKRLVYSDDGLIFYTEDHYESFEQLPGGGA